MGFRLFPKQAEGGAEGSSHRRTVVYCAAAVAAGLLLAGVVGYRCVVRLNSSPGRVKLYQVTIGEGASARQIARQLEQDRIIRSARFFALAARLMEFDRKIHAGTHWVDGSETTTTILRQLLSGGLRIAKVTVPEGFTVAEIARLAAAELPFPPDSVLALADDSALVARYAFPGAQSLEGFLFPDTYFLDASANSRTLLGTMATRFRALFSDEMRARADSIGMSPLQVLTLASIIEKEAMVAQERPIISQVFHLRLKRGYKLGADPTVKYALVRDRRRLSLRDIEIDSPYNTYRYPGLPPGPICNPGIDAIRAALWPASTNYLYFVSNWDGTHTFTRTLREHNLAKAESERRYRRWRAEQRRRPTP